MIKLKWYPYFNADVQNIEWAITLYIEIIYSIREAKKAELGFLTIPVGGSTDWSANSYWINRLQRACSSPGVS